MEIISDNADILAFVCIMLVALGLWAGIAVNFFRKSRSVVSDDRNLRQLTSRDALQAFLDLNNITGDADIRESIVHPHTDEAKLSDMAQVYARMLRNTYNSAVHRTSNNLIGGRALLYIENSLAIPTDLTFGDLIEIADILERMK